MICSAVVFDFDGLIVDTEGPVYEAWNEVYREHGQELSLDFWKTTVGSSSDWFDPFQELEQRLGRSLDREALRTALRVRERELVAAQPILPGVREWRREARDAGIKLGVASNSGEAWVLGHLERLGLGDGWDCIRCRTQSTRPKPDPELYLAVLECLAVGPETAIAVEDSGHGVEAAKAAGLHCVAVPNPMTEDHDLARADVRLGSLADIGLLELARTL